LIDELILLLKLFWKVMLLASIIAIV